MGSGLRTAQLAVGGITPKVRTGPKALPEGIKSTADFFVFGKIDIFAPDNGFCYYGGTPF